MARVLALLTALAVVGPDGGALVFAESYDVPQVVGGAPVSPGQFPFLVRVVSKSSNVCTGSLIADDWVLTAAHCGEPDRVYITDARPPSGGAGHSIYYIEPKRWIPHPGFNPAAAPENFEGDLALIQLKLNASDFPPEIDGVPVYTPTPIGLAGSPSTTATSIGDVTIAGFGFTENAGSLPLVAEWAEYIPTIPAASCLFPTVAAEELCYGTFPNNCSGDSGSAVFRHLDGAYAQYGVVSIVTASCGAGNSRATYVPGYLSWINDQMTPPSSPEIILGWELPGSVADGDVATGVSNGQGWTYSNAGTIESVEMYVDGKLEQTFPCCGERGDVKDVHPSAPPDTGFSGAVSWPRFGPGNHQMMLKVTDSDGNVKTETRTVKVVQILPGVNFARDLSTASASCAFVGTESFRCSGLSFKQGTCATDIEFSWSNAKQAWEASAGCDP